MFDTFERVNSIFNHQWPLGNAYNTELSGKVNIKHLGNTSNIYIVVPGFTKKDLDISVENNVLIVSTIKDFKGGNTEDMEHMEYTMAPFERKFTLKNHDVESIESSLKNGILTISLKKTSDQELKKIPIK